MRPVRPFRTTPTLQGNPRVMSSPIDPRPSDTSGTAPRLRVDDAACTACGCLCDDIILDVVGGKIVEATNACDRGRGWFLADHGHEGLPQATIEGRPASADEAVDRAVEILRKARAPVVLGLTQTTTEAVAAALSLADRVGAVVDPGPGGRDTIGRILAVQRVGRVSATLGEVKNRADTVVFWGVDPVATHPRHWERYSVEPKGRFVPEGRAGRTVIVVDTRRTATADRADLFLLVEETAWFETLWTLRALVRGVPLDPARVQRSTGLNPAALQGLADRLKGAQYGAWFLGEPPGGPKAYEAALTLVRDLNTFTRFVILGLGSPGNAVGAEAALTWQTGFPTAVSLAGRVPESLPGSTSAETLLARGETDAAVVVATGLPSGLSDAANERLRAIPTIIIGPKAARPGNHASVALDSATNGIDAPGTVMRSDGIILTLRPPLKADVLSDLEWLRRIEGRLALGPDRGKSV